MLTLPGRTNTSDTSLHVLHVQRANSAPVSRSIERRAQSAVSAIASSVRAHEEKPPIKPRPAFSAPDTQVDKVELSLERPYR